MGFAAAAAALEPAAAAGASDVPGGLEALVRLQSVQLAYSPRRACHQMSAGCNQVPDRHATGQIVVQSRDYSTESNKCKSAHGEITWAASKRCASNDHDSYGYVALCVG